MQGILNATGVGMGLVVVLLAFLAVMTWVDCRHRKKAARKQLMARLNKAIDRE